MRRQGRKTDRKANRTAPPDKTSAILVAAQTGASGGPRRKSKNVKKNRRSGKNNHPVTVEPIDGGAGAFMPVAPRILYCVPGRLFFQPMAEHVCRPTIGRVPAKRPVSALCNNRNARVTNFPAGDRFQLRRAAVPGDGETIVVAQDIEHGVFP